MQNDKVIILTGGSSGIGDMVVVLLLGVVLLARPRGFAGAAVGARA